MDTRIGVVGGAGFVGVNFAAAALARGYQTVIIDVGDRLGRLAHSGLLDRTRCHLVDVATPGAEVPEVDVLLHLAALPHVDFSLYHPETVTTNNVGVHATVLATARRRQTPVLFTSSVEVYGGNDGAMFDEEDPLVALSPYAASKIACESLTASYQAVYGSLVTTVRLTNLYGPWQAPDRVLPRVTGQAIVGHPAEASADRIRDFLFVDDAVRALLLLIERGAWGGVFSLSSGIGVEVEEAARMVVDAVGHGSLRIVDAPLRDGRGGSLVASPQRLMNAVDWKPEVPLDTGIERTVAWYRDNQTWWRRFEPLLRASRQGPEFLVDHVYAIQN
jgi:dTDP-glucose 4,6-dehydratase